MSIQWFPGHMTSARKAAAAAMAHNDVVVEVLDARLPEASSNPMIAELRAARQRPCLKLLNKADLADPEATSAWLDYYARQAGVQAFAISSKKSGSAKKIVSLCRKLAPSRDSAIKPLRLMIMGIPNVGKSTLINSLLNKRIAAVGDEPAVTKQQQRIELGLGVVLTDTPGLMWPKIHHEADAYMLAASHAIGRNAVINEPVARFLLDILLQRYPAQLAHRYKLDLGAMDAVDVMSAVALKRGCLSKGGKRLADMEKAAMLILTDYRSGALGRISLETPASRAQMLASVGQAAGNAVVKTS